jgi:hypothetical protein
MTKEGDGADVVYLLQGLRDGSWAIERSERGEPGEFNWMERASEQQLVEFIEIGIVPKDAGKLN